MQPEYSTHGNRTEDGPGVDEELRISQLPEAFLKRVSGQLGSELPFFLSAMSQPYIRGLRMNPFRNGGDQPFRDAVARIEWEKNGWEFQWSQKQDGRSSMKRELFIYRNLLLWCLLRF